MMTGRPQEPDEDYAPSESVTSSSAYITDPGEEDSDCDGTNRGTKRKASQQEVELKPCQSCGEDDELVLVGTGRFAKRWCKACSTGHAWLTKRAPVNQRATTKAQLSQNFAKQCKAEGTAILQVHREMEEKGLRANSHAGSAYKAQRLGELRQSVTITREVRKTGLGVQVLPERAWIAHQKYTEGYDRVLDDGVEEAQRMWDEARVLHPLVQTEDGEPGLPVKLRGKIQASDTITKSATYVKSDQVTEANKDRLAGALQGPLSGPAAVGDATFASVGGDKLLTGLNAGSLATPSALRETTGTSSPPLAFDCSSGRMTLMSAACTPGENGHESVVSGVGRGGGIVCWYGLCRVMACEWVGARRVGNEVGNDWYERFVELEYCTGFGRCDRYGRSHRRHVMRSVTRTWRSSVPPSTDQRHHRRLSRSNSPARRAAPASGHEQNESSIPEKDHLCTERDQHKERPVRTGVGPLQIIRGADVAGQWSHRPNT